MIKINVKKEYIPIPFLDEDGGEVFELRFYKTDENIKRLKNFYDDFEEMQKEYEGKKLSFEEEKERDKMAIDATLGEGSFDRMYELHDSLMIVNEYYVEICIGIMQELGLKETSKALEKYRNG